MPSMLLNEPFVAVFPSLVRRLGGMNEAAVLQAIHFASQIKQVQIDGADWVPATCADLSRQTGLSVDAVHRAIKALRDLGVLISTQAEAGTRRQAHRIAYDQLEDDRTGRRESAAAHTAKSRDPNRESAVSTTTKKREEPTKNSSPMLPELAHPTAATVVKAFVDAFTARHGRPPDRGSIGRLSRDAKLRLAEGIDHDLLIAAAQRCAAKAHANLSAALLSVLGDKPAEPKGFAGIREMLEDSDDQN